MAIPFKPADPTIDGIISGLAGPRASALMKLREIIHEAVPDVTESAKRKQPHFDSNGPMCWVKAHPAHLNFLFERGDDVDDPTGALRPFGKDKIRYMRIANEDDIDAEVVAALVRSAAKLNRESPAKPKARVHTEF